MDNNEFNDLEDIMEDEIVSQDTNNNTMQNSVNSFDRINNARKAVNSINDYRMNRISKNMNSNNDNSKKKNYNVKDNLNVRNSYKDQLKSDNKFNDKIASSKVKSLFNKNTNSNSKDENNDEGLKNKIKDKVEKKAAGMAVTAATGGALQGEAAQKVGEVALKVKKQFIDKKKKKFYLVIGISAGIVIFFLFMIMFFAGNVDRSDTNSNTSAFISGSMTDEELVDYLSYISVCPDSETLKKVYDGDDVFEIIYDNPDKLSTCQNAIDYYKAIKEEYEQNGKACYRDRNEDGEMLGNFYRHDGDEASLSTNPKAKTYFNGKHTIDYAEQVENGYYDCQLNLPTQLLLETMSYDYTDSELFQDEGLKKNNPEEGLFDDYNVDFRKLTNGLSEFVHEACFMWEIKYVDAAGKEYDTPCTGCTMKKEKVAYDGYYFQNSFNKYVCYLKYGDTCTHPNYSGKPLEKNEDMDYYAHECEGPSNDGLSHTNTGEGTVACSTIGDDLEACKNRSDCTIEDGMCKSKTGGDYDEDFDVVKGDGNEVVAYAMKFIGLPYIWGGSDLTKGVDCSGFTLSIFKKFGVNLPHSADAQKNYGKHISSLSEAKPGDLLCFSGHVGIYIGNNTMVHASGSQKKPKWVKTQDLGTYGKKIVTIRRLVE